MNREVHVRFWERAGVKFLRATRQNLRLPQCNSNGRFTSVSRHLGMVSIWAVAPDIHLLMLARRPCCARSLTTL
jgi:hypothetical protein